MSCRRHPQIDCLVLSAGKKVDDEGVDLVGCFPHRDVTALLDDVKFRTRDSTVQGLTHRGRKQEVILSPDDQGGPVDTGQAFPQPHGILCISKRGVKAPRRSFYPGEPVLAIDHLRGDPCSCPSRTPGGSTSPNLCFDLHRPDKGGEETSRGQRAS